MPSALNNPVTGLGALAFFMIDMHFLAARAGLFGQRCVDCAFENLWHADNQRPIDLAGRVGGETLGIAGR